MELWKLVFGTFCVFGIVFFGGLMTFFHLEGDSFRELVCAWCMLPSVIAAGTIR